MKKEQRDLVYDLNVNPISKIFDNGIFIWGNKTAYDKNSKLRSLNVRRMINFDIVQPLRSFLINYLFKPFSPTYVIEIQNHLSDMVRNLKNSGKVEDMTFDVKANTNTNELIVNLYIKPIGAIEYITINLNVLPTSGEITTTQ
jgi:phage tail sheath protein FI